MKRIILILTLFCVSLSVAYSQISKHVTRYDLPEGELRWTTVRPKDAKMCIPAAFTTEDGKVAGAYRLLGKTHQKEVYKMKVSLKGSIFYISPRWVSDNGFQQLTLVYNSRAMKFKSQDKSMRRALCKDAKGAFILESNYPMTLTRFALECSKQSTNATYLDMGEYGYGYIKQGPITVPLFAPAIFTQHKQTNWIYIE